MRRPKLMLCERKNPETKLDQNVERRLRALSRYHILDSDPEAEFTNIALLAAAICGAPIAAISFLVHGRQWFKAGIGLDVGETPIGHSFCRHACAANDVFVVNDASTDKRFGANPLVTGEADIRFYAGMRITASDGTPIGALCVLDTKVRPQGISPAEHLALQALAAQVQTLLELRLALLEQKKQLRSNERLTDQLRFVAEHDGLTGVLRREPFQARLAQALAMADEQSRVAIAIVDVDHFKQLNDVLGHDAGDELLRTFASRLKRVLRAGDSIARLGGDEFGILISGIDSRSSLDHLIESINNRLSEPLIYKGRTIECHASIGVAVYPDHASTSDALLKCSDLALAQAKEARGCAIMFNPVFGEKFKRETQMLEVARAGLREHRIVPHYQAKIDLDTGRIVGFEALVRCAQTDGSLLLPEAFAHAFIDQSTARLIGKVMIEQVLDDVQEWNRKGVDFGRVAINTCVADFQGNDFGERLLNGILRRGIKPEEIEIEVTEGVFLGRGADYVCRTLDLISTHGVHISLDDFGTGYASLTHLKQFPVDSIKIDRSFVSGIGKRADDDTIVKTLVSLGKSLGIGIIAEGLESVQQIAFVKALGCRIGQGFYFGRAMPSALVPVAVLRSCSRSAA